MEWLQLAIAAVGSVGLWKFAESVLRIRHDKRVGVRQEDRADRQQGVLELEKALAELRTQLNEARDEADKLDQHLATMRAEARLKDEYIAELRDHIWRQLPPPPPPRPVTA